MTLRIYSALALLSFLLGIAPRLFWGFWTDEAGTYWMASGGLTAALAKTAEWPGQSLLYSAIASFFAVDGPMKEFVLRLPSVVGLILAAYFVFRLAERFAGCGTGFLAVIPFLCLSSTIQAASDARPYSLALAASTASFWYLERWCESGRKKHAAVYFAACVLVVYLHYCFAFIFVVHGIYLAVRRREVNWSVFAAGATVSALALLPAAQHIQRLTERTMEFAGAVKPGLAHFGQLTFPLGLYLPVALGLVTAVCGLRGGFARNWPVKRVHMALIAVWMLLGPIVFFVIAQTTEHSVFSTRYLLFASVPGCLLVAAAAGLLRETKARVLVMIAVVAGTVAHPGNLLSLAAGRDEDWREPAALAAHHAQGSPVFVRSGLTESNLLPWRNPDAIHGRLFAPLLAYPLNSPVEPLPFHLRPDVEAHLTNRGARFPRFLLLAATQADMVAFAKRTFSATHRLEEHQAGGMSVIVFERPPD